MYEEDKCIKICECEKDCKPKRRNRCCVDVVIFTLSILLTFTIGLLVGSAISATVLGALAAFIILAVILFVLIIVRIIDLICGCCKKHC